VHAVVMKVEISNYEEAKKFLESEIIPSVKQAPGFVSGVWIPPNEDTGEGFSVVVVDSEDQAKAMQSMLPKPGEAVNEAVSVKSVEVRRVAGVA